MRLGRQQDSGNCAEQQREQTIRWNRVHSLERSPPEFLQQPAKRGTLKIFVSNQIDPYRTSGVFSSPTALDTRYLTRRMSTRRESRERVMQALYAFELGSGDAEHVIATLIHEPLSEDKPAREFAEKLFLRTLDHSTETDAVIERHTENWELSRIALIDRLILRMALCELITFEDIPPKVSINEAIEVAKKYSTNRSGQFVNGILDASLESLGKDGRMTKKGRGLIGTSTSKESTD
jgi:transcription antitermination protein NusB